jgi:ADP-heptose:LPS heptosyltransferase
MEGMDAEREGAPAEEGASPDAQPADAMEGEMEAEMEPQEDFSQDTRMQEMINHLAECLENFKQEDHWKNEHYHNIKDFLENPAEKVLFFWNAFEPEFD